jgi:aminoglycoside phosphotransferase (APT) family kinase protein
LWDRAVTLFHGPRLDPDQVFIHRDYHPGNVLWRCGGVSGVVDWQAASVGPRSADVFWCRSNLIGRFGLEVADRFIRIWESVSGATYHPWAEVVMLVDVIGWAHDRGNCELRDLELALARSLAELGG